MKICKVAFILALLSINYAAYSQCGGVATFTDTRDSKVYNMIQIDGSTSPYCIGTSQCWMAENLNVGTQIGPSVNQSNNGTIEKYCHGGVNGTSTEGDCSSWGGLYQWDEVMAYGTSQTGNGPGPQGICPSGWHIPTDNEWKCLEMNLGMTQTEADNFDVWRGTDQGTQLKSGGSSGFEALLVGHRRTDNKFYDNGKFTTYWTSTEQSATEGRKHTFLNTQAKVFAGRNNKQFGIPVRCINNTSPIPLPIELLYFKVNWTDDKLETATLKWETITESQNSHFEIERSTDAIHFEYIKTVLGNGTSNQNIEYTTLDEDPYVDGTSYYRLKQVDHNGDFEYSNIEALNVPEGLNMINLYPNPTVDQITVLFTSSEDTESTISIKNNLGQEVRQFNNKISKGYNSMNFSFSELSTGNYTIQISTTSGLYKVEQKFIKTNQ